jgi:hypothetical protein
LFTGSPFQAKVVDPNKVHFVGGASVIDPATNTVKLTLNQINTIEVDTHLAGPGKETDF